MIQLIKKGGLRERANRSRKYQGSENTATTLHPNRYPSMNKPSLEDSIQNEKESIPITNETKSS